MKHLGLLVTFTVLLSMLSWAQADTEVIKVTSPVRALSNQLGATINDNTEPYRSGKIASDTAKALLTSLGALGDPNPPTTIIHLLRWANPEHTKVKFQKWYLYDPSPSKTSFYLQSKEEVFQRTAIPGRTALQLVYIHLNSDLAAGDGEWKVQDADGIHLIHGINYTITITKQQTQFVQDLKTVLQLATGIAAAADTSKPGYYSIAPFQSQWSTSSIAIAATLDTSTEKTKGSDTQNGTAASLANNTYTNEAPTWIGLSAGVLVNGYKDLTFQQGTSTITAKTIDSQHTYIMLDGYVPPVIPSLWGFRYIPHPFFGLPLKGKVFRHTMIGAGIGLRWIEPFGGIVFDTEGQKGTAPAPTATHLKIQPVGGLKFSVSDIAKALKKK